MNPPQTVVAAMPGTLADLARATGYPVGEVLRAIQNARREGVRVNAVMDHGSSASARVDPEWTATTIYQVDNATPHSGE